jgi:hypothetical protein
LAASASRSCANAGAAMSRPNKIHRHMMYPST